MIESWTENKSAGSPRLTPSQGQGHVMACQYRKKSWYRVSTRDHAVPRTIIWSQIIWSSSMIYDSVYSFLVFRVKVLRIQIVLHKFTFSHKFSTFAYKYLLFMGEKWNQICGNFCHFLIAYTICGIKWSGSSERDQIIWDQVNELQQFSVRF